MLKSPISIPKTPEVPKAASGALKATMDKMPMAKQQVREDPQYTICSIF
jgi:hypothetical protein